MKTLRINEIYLSIQGESTFAGRPCVFIRTTGCPLRCVWCDTAYAFHEGSRMSLDEIVGKTLSFDVPLVEVTGGEPLAQKAALDLLARLCDLGKTVLLETSGAFDIDGVDERVHIIMDIKCPDSGESERNFFKNVERLRGKDEVKFVLASRKDYEYAKAIVGKFDLAARCEVLLSTVFGLINPKEVVGWMLADKLPTRFQIQLHKHIWLPTARGV